MTTEHQARTANGNGTVPRQERTSFLSESTLSASKSPSDGALLMNSNAELLLLRLQSSENELLDTKRLLLDAICDKRELEAQKAELAACIAELTGNIIDPEDTSEVITDRAKRTMMRLRMERTEGIKQRLLSVVRQKSHDMMQIARSVKEKVIVLKMEFESQFERVNTLLQTSRNTFAEVVEQIREKAAAENEKRGGGSGLPELPSGATYLDLITAAVQEQQKTIVLPPDHPVIVSLKGMLDNYDAMVEQLNKSWSQLKCFQEGKPPELPKLRRFIDPIVNLKNYGARCNQIRSWIEYADVATTVFTEMQLPQLERTSQRMISVADTRLKAKLSAAFDAMRVIRCPVSVLNNRSLSNLFRIFASAEGVPPKQIQELTEEYRSRSQRHTRHCFKYVGEMLSITRKFAVADTKKNLTAIDLLLQKLPMPLKGASDPSKASSACCETCSLPMVCEDCYALATFSGDRQRYLSRRKQLILDFTEKRMKHLTSLTSMIDEVLLCLRKARVISIHALQVATRTEPKGDGGPGTPSKSVTVVVSPHKSPHRTDSPSKKQLAMARRPTLATELLIHKGGAAAIKSSTFYFEQLRHQRREVLSRTQPIAPRGPDYDPRSLPPYNGEGPPRTKPEQEKFIEDLKFLEKLHPTKPQSARGVQRGALALMNRPVTQESRRPKRGEGIAPSPLKPSKLGPLIDQDLARSLALAMEHEKELDSLALHAHQQETPDP